MLGEVAPKILFLFGVGFLIANLRIGIQTLRFLKRRSSAVLTWKGSKPRYYGLQLGLGVVLGILLLYDAFYLRRPAAQIFGGGMMFVYYGYGMTLSLRIVLGLC